MRIYDFIPISTDHENRYIVMRKKKTYIVDLVSGEYIQTGENEDINGWIGAEKFGMYDRTFHFPEDAMEAIGEIMNSEWIEA